MTWTEASSNSTTYQENKGTDWDSGASLWDVFGNTVESYWDYSSSTTYSEQSATSVTWTTV